ncbi:DUF4249 domain-containing protein [Parabacteroides sp. OttesenSCG-928-G07]|nr:DUF4249 domain-containing protein [Parabacteroides sp. OttesenSCG-928-G07]
MLKRGLCYLIICCLTGCISEFEPEGIVETTGLLVVEGGIMAPVGTSIKLSRTKELSAILKATPVTSAVVQIIDENETVIATAKQEVANDGELTGTYNIEEEITLRPDGKYAVAIQLDGKRYRSSYQSPLSTPEIDEVDWVRKSDEEVEIRVSTHTEENKDGYYLWKYTENWEVISQLMPEYRWNPVKEEIEQMSINGPNVYYCWDKAQSSSFILGKSDKLETNAIKNKVIHTIEKGGTRLSYLYSIQVTQCAIQQDAYIYFDNLQKNVAETGSIFAPQPTEMEGNIVCLSDPEEPVIGYVYVSSATQKRIFIDAADVPGMIDIMDCSDNMEPIYNRPKDPEDGYRHGFGINIMQGDYVVSYRPLRCVDCTMRGGFKVKPDFWPNHHQ